jgi:hypothetical protein
MRRIDVAYFSVESTEFVSDPSKTEHTRNCIKNSSLNIGCAPLADAKNLKKEDGLKVFNNVDNRFNQQNIGLLTANKKERSY